MNIYAIFDKKLGEYMQPFPAPNNVTVTRGLVNQLKEPSVLSDNPHDFRLDCVGRFEKETGLLISHPNAVFVEEIANLVSKPLPTPIPAKPEKVGQ